MSAVGGGHQARGRGRAHVMTNICTIDTHTYIRMHINMQIDRYVCEAVWVRLWLSELSEEGNDFRRASYVESYKFACMYVHMYACIKGCIRTQDSWQWPQGMFNRILFPYLVRGLQACE